MARFTNQAQLRYGRSIANSNIAVGEILEVLSAAKEAATFSCTWLAVFFQILAAQYSRTFQALSGNSYG